MLAVAVRPRPTRPRMVPSRPNKNAVGAARVPVCAVSSAPLAAETAMDAAAQPRRTTRWVAVVAAALAAEVAWEMEVAAMVAAAALPTRLMEVPAPPIRTTRPKDAAVHAAMVLAAVLAAVARARAVAVTAAVAARRKRPNPKLSCTRVSRCNSCREGARDEPHSTQGRIKEENEKCRKIIHLSSFKAI